MGLPIYILNNHARGFQFLHILDNTCYFLSCFFVFYFNNDHPIRYEMGYLFFHVAFLHVAGVGARFQRQGRQNTSVDPTWFGGFACIWKMSVFAFLPSQLGAYLSVRGNMFTYSWLEFVEFQRFMYLWELVSPMRESWDKGWEQLLVWPASEIVVW